MSTRHFKDILDDAQSRIKTMQELLEVSKREIGPNSNFDISAKNTKLHEDLKSLQDSIVDFSRICLERATSFNESLQSIECDVQEIDSTLNIIKDNAGNSSISRPQAEQPKGSKSEAESDQDYSFAHPTTISQPGPDFTINLSALDNVGLKSSNPAANVELICELKPGQTHPTPWSRPTDFFLLKPGASAPNSAIMSSFSEAYPQAPAAQPPASPGKPAEAPPTSSPSKPVEASSAPAPAAEKK